MHVFVLLVLPGVEPGEPEVILQFLKLVLDLEHDAGLAGTPVAQQRHRERRDLFLGTEHGGQGIHEAPTAKGILQCRLVRSTNEAVSHALVDEGSPGAGIITWEVERHDFVDEGSTQAVKVVALLSKHVLNLRHPLAIEEHCRQDVARSNAGPPGHFFRQTAGLIQDDLGIFVYASRGRQRTMLPCGSSNLVAIRETEEIYRA